MITIIKECNVYAPENLGVKDVVIAGGKIEGVYDNVDFDSKTIEYEVINGKDKLLFPGFIDCHVHVMGGGGEGGFHTRIPEMQMPQLTKEIGRAHV